MSVQIFSEHACGGSVRRVCVQSIHTCTCNLHMHMHMRMHMRMRMHMHIHMHMHMHMHMHPRHALAALTAPLFTSAFSLRNMTARSCTDRFDAL